MEDDSEELVPRNYQVALFEKCMNGNTIIFLPTGAGKTFIAIMALKRMGAALLGENHKVCIILVNTVALVDQHTKYVKQHTIFECGGYSGEMNVDFWKAETWVKQFQKNRVLVMTCEILTGIVRGKIIDLNRVNLLIFDECHHAVNDHSMRQLMTNFQNLYEPPRVIGLTATLLNGNCKPEKVMSEVRSLEITFQSKVATVEGLEVVVGYATNPQEFLRVYEPHELTPLEVDCQHKIDEVIGNLEKLKIFDPEVDDRVKNTNLRLLEPIDAMKQMLNMLKDLKLHMTMLGIFGGRLACLARTIHIERLKKHCDNMLLSNILNYIQTVLGYIVSKYDRRMESCRNEKERFWTYSSNKVKTLIRILDEFHIRSNETLCGLIFVERRFTAKLVFHVLDSLSKCDPDYSYIRSDYIIGNNNNPLCETRENLYITKKNKQVLVQFANKEINLLCTSQVLEEGIDIPKCTFVCKFDFPKDYRSYIQSKGRARHKTSLYFMMVQTDGQPKFDKMYAQFQEVERTLNDFLVGKNHERKAPSKEEIEDMFNDDLIPPYYVNGLGSAYVNQVSAISLLYRYCQTLPADQYTIHNPEWYFEVAEKQGVENSVVVTILMPTICPIMEPIVGMPMKNKKLAKRAAAYVACIKLHKLGELNDSLLPKVRTVEEEDVSYIFEHHPKEKEEAAGGKKMRAYDVQIPLAVRGVIAPDCDVHLHIIHLDPLFPRSDGDAGNETVYDMYSSILCYGFLTPKPLPNTFTFPTYLSNGTIMVSILNNVKTVRLSKHQLWIIRRFHFLVFSDVLKIANHLSFLIMDNSDIAESMIVVPVQRDLFEIDFRVLKKNYCIKTSENILNHTEKVSLVVNDEEYLHKIVIPFYRRDAATYLVTEVCSNMNPASKFPNDDYRDFCHYYMAKHQERIVNLIQPMLLVKALTNKLSMYMPRGAEMKKRKEKLHGDPLEYLVPEMLVKQEFPAPLWIQARLLPTILSRLSYTLRVETLWQRIGQDCNFVMKEDNMRSLYLNTDLIRYVPVTNEAGSTPVKQNYERSESVPALLTSLKSSACNKDFQAKILESKYPWKDLEEPKNINKTLELSVMDIEDYENFISHKVSNNDRKDVYGSPVSSKYPALTYHKDFVEKSIHILTERNFGIVELADMYEAMTTSRANDIVNLERLETLGDSFLKYITSFYITLNFPDYDEGMATQLKGRIISNRNLYYWGLKHDFGGIMKNKDLNAKCEWLPPGFSVPPQIRREISEKKVSVSCLFRCSFSRDERISGKVDDSSLNSLMESYALNGEDDSMYQNMDQFLQQHSLRDKCIADVVEAILGTYLLKIGIKACIKVIHWIGIIPRSDSLQNLFAQPPPNPLRKENATLKEIVYHQPLYSEIEKIIDYEFKNKGYLLQAFTHASYTPNRVTQSYEKLEFLGDAILDFLVTCFIYESCGNLTPGELTDLRSALVNNNTFASYTVRLGLHKFLLMMNSKLQNHIDKFVEFMTMKNFEIDDEVLILLEEEDLNLAEYVDVPKVLGDIFEALAGAVFLDSGYSLEVVWKVFYKIMWREIDLFSAKVPKNMIRRLFECETAYPEFGNAQSTHNGRVMIKLHFHAEGRPRFVHGFGSNKMLAKKAAAKIALRYL